MNKAIKNTTSLLLSTVLSACAVGPNYEVPKSKLMPFHNQIKAADKDTKTVSLDKWWLGFNDPELVNVVQRTLEQNLDLRAAIAQVIQARAVAHGSNAKLLPTVDANTGITQEHLSLFSPFGIVAKDVPGFRRNFADYTVGLSASWEIDLFGGLHRGAAAAKDEAEAAEMEQVGTRIMVAAEAADAYFQIRGYQSRIEIAKQQIKDDEHLLRLVHDQHNAGGSTGREIAQAEAVLKQARATLPPLRIGIEQQLNRLDVLMGVQPGTYIKELKLTTEIASIPAIPGKQYPIDVLRRRPDVIAAERRLAASSERIGVAISEYYPKINLTEALGFDSISSRYLFNNKATQAIGGGALRWRLFDFGKVDSEVAQARGANYEALAHYRQSILRATEDVENSLNMLSETKIYVDELNGEVKALVKARNLSVQAYKAGSITLTDVLDADRQLLVARDQLNAKKVDTARAAVVVFRALGGGWYQPQKEK